MTTATRRDRNTIPVDRAIGLHLVIPPDVAAAAAALVRARAGADADLIIDALDLELPAQHPNGKGAELE